jgi:CHASE3 domain sensor protein
MPLGLQVAAGVGVLVALVALSAVVAVLLVVGLRENQRELHTQSVPYANAVAAAALRAKAIANDERGYLITADPEFVAQIEERIPKAQAAFTQAYGLAEGGAQELAIVEAHAGFERWIASVRSEIALVKAGKQKRAIEVALGSGRAVRKDYELSLGRAEALARTDIAADQDSVTTASSRSVAILIACLGLFGLATFTAQQRTKEIGVRKVLGASVPYLVGLLTKDFLKLVAMAVVIASPVAYLLMSRWLEGFSYRIDIGPGILVLVGLVALLIAMLTVAYQAIRAATADTVKALRSE